MPQNKPMKIQWITVNGRQVPLVLPQTYSYADDDWKVTSDRDPLPIVEYGTTAGGVVVPKRVSDEGHELTQLTGRNIEEVYFFNAIAISTTDLIESDTIDLSKYKKITILARNSLNQEVGLYLDYRSANAGFMHVWENGSWKPRNDTSLKLPPTGGYSIFNLNSVWQELRYDPLKTIRLRAKCDNAPTSGALTVFAVGVIN